jgi:hypothetical protein
MDKQWRVAQAFDLAIITNPVGIPFLRVLPGLKYVKIENHVSESLVI